MKNDKEKFKTEFKLRIYKWVLKLIEELFKEIVEISNILGSSLITLNGRNKL